MRLYGSQDQAPTEVSTQLGLHRDSFAAIPLYNTTDEGFSNPGQNESGASSSTGVYPVLDARGMALYLLEMHCNGVEFAVEKDSNPLTPTFQEGNDIIIRGCILFILAGKLHHPCGMEPPEPAMNCVVCRLYLDDLFRLPRQKQDQQKVLIKYELSCYLAANTLQPTSRRLLPPLLAVLSPTPKCATGTHLSRRDGPSVANTVVVTLALSSSRAEFLMGIGEA